MNVDSEHVVVAGIAKVRGQDDTGEDPETGAEPMMETESEE